MDRDVIRIVDANLNRAREALRLIEDHARFALDDVDAATRAKHARHSLRTLVDALGADALLAARAILSDVGRDAKTPGEMNRPAAEDVVRAAFARLSEATRTLGEYAKLAAPMAAGPLESLRYAAYELEQRISLRGRLRQRFRAVRVYGLLTEQLCHTDWRTTAELLLHGGAGCIQLREKNLPDAELLARARWLRDLTRHHGALLAINDRPDIARLANADIVHVGQTDLGVHDVRRTTGADRLVGKSTHTPEQFAAALAEGPDYLAVGPMFPSGTKPQDHIAGIATLRAVREQTELPLVAIGGITPANAAAAFDAGATSVAVCAAILAADDIESATRAFADCAAQHAADTQP